MAYSGFLKEVEWLGASWKEFRRLPDDSQIRISYALYLVQRGLEPSHWKPMGGIGPGVIELRIQGERAYRVFYLARFAEAVYVLHLFEKKSRKTSGLDLEIGRVRYRKLLRERTGR
jgi:phage-related protein